MMKDITLGDFLRTRRAFIVGYDDATAVSVRKVRARRVPGLRRAEMASRIGVSPDYYAKLEQPGRKVVPSESVLRALAEVLQLDDAAKEHMYDLVRLNATSERQREPKAQRVGTGMLHMVESFTDLPALLLGRRTDIVAANDAARLLFVDFNALPVHDRNALKLVLLNDQLSNLHRDWEAVAAALVGMLRMDAGRHPHDPRTAELVDELGRKSELFNHLWNSSCVARGINQDQVIEHPIIGRIRLHVESLQTTHDRDLTLHLMVPASDASSQSARRQLQELARNSR